MSIIYQKISGANQEQCLILGPREALVYPFNLGEYQEIRFGIFFSMTAANDSNTAYTNETVGTGNPKNKLYIGFKDHSVNFPFTPNSSFIGNGSLPSTNNGAGVANVALSNQAIVTVSSGGSTMANIYSISGENGTQVFSGYNLRSIALGSPLRIPTTAQVTSTTNYMSFFGGKLLQTGSQFSYFSTYDNLNTYGTGTQLALRTLISRFPNQDGINGINGISGIFSGAQLNSLFIYMPFSGNQVRIHGLVVDKYA